MSGIVLRVAFVVVIGALVGCKKGTTKEQQDALRAQIDDAVRQCDEHLALAEPQAKEAEAVGLGEDANKLRAARDRAQSKLDRVKELRAQMPPDQDITENQGADLSDALSDLRDALDEFRKRRRDVEAKIRQKHIRPGD